MVNNLEQPNISFKKDSGRETKVKILNEVPIAKGTQGEAFDVVVEVGGHSQRMVIKRYNNRHVSDSENKKRARNAFDKYSIAKSAGLKVFPTFRIGGDNQSILMTSGFSNDKICIACNSHEFNVSKFERPLIKEIKNVDELLASFFAEAMKATQGGIGLTSDSVFFIVDREEPAQVDFVFGDLDFLSKGKISKFLARENIGEVRRMLSFFCSSNFSRSYQGTFTRKIETFYRKATEEIESSDLPNHYD